MLRASSVVLTPRAYSRTRCGVAALEDGAARGFLSARPLGPSLNCVDDGNYVDGKVDTGVAPVLVVREYSQEEDLA